MLTEAENPGAQLARLTGNKRRLHSIHGLLRGRVVDAKFEVRGKPYRFSFLPATAAIADGKVVLTGRLTTHSPQLGIRFVDGVSARLVASQGGVGASPPRRQLTTGIQSSQISTPEQKMEQEKGPETDLQPGLRPFDGPRVDELGRPTVDATGPLGFVGVLYFQLSSLDGSTLGVPLDLSEVQLNLRLAPTDDLTRDLQVVFSDVVAALYGEQKDEREASEQVERLNGMLKS